MHKYQHTTPIRPEYQPNQHNPPEYGKKIQYAESADATPPLDKDEIRELMRLVGSLLFLGRAISNTLLTAWSNIATEQEKSIKTKQEYENNILNYWAIHPNRTIIFQGSQMALKVNSDAS